MAVPLAWVVLLQHRILSFFAGIPHGSYRIPAPPWWITAPFLLGLVAVVMALRPGRATARWERGLLAVFVGSLAVVIATYPFQPRVSANQLELTVLDVGQGDALLLVSPKGSTLLIDGGGMFLGFRELLPGVPAGRLSEHESRRWPAGPLKPPRNRGQPGIRDFSGIVSN